MDKCINGRLDLLRAVYAKHRKAQCFKLLPALALQQPHLLAGGFQLHKGTLAAQQQDQSVRHT